MSHNVFADMGLPNPEDELMKARLVHLLSKVIAEKRLTPEEAAQQLKVALLGFARAVSDLATYAYLTDVVIDEPARGQGLGRWLIECILAHPDFQSLRRIALVTLDAQGLYEPFGFGTDIGAHTYMELRTLPQITPEFAP